MRTILNDVVVVIGIQNIKMLGSCILSRNINITISLNSITNQIICANMRCFINLELQDDYQLKLRYRR
jgi:hypothetical protein